MKDSLTLSKIVKQSLFVWLWFFDRRPRIWVLVKILIVSVTGKFGHPWRLNLFLKDDVPVDAIKPRTLFYIVSSICHAAQSLREVGSQQSLNESSCFYRYLCRKFKIAESDFTVDFVGILIVEGWKASQHFKQQNPQRPPINSMTVSS